MPFSFLLSCRLPLQQIHFVRQHRFAVAEKSDDDWEADGSLRGSIGNDEKREDLSSYVTVQTGKGDQVDVQGIQNQLDGQEHDDNVAPRDESEHPADAEREDEEIVEPDRE